MQSKMEKLEKYISISFEDSLWEKLSTDLRGKCFRVACSWRNTGIIKQKDWEMLVRKNYVGKRIYVQKAEIYYKDPLNSPKLLYHMPSVKSVALFCQRLSNDYKRLQLQSKIVENIYK